MAKNVKRRFGWSIDTTVQPGGLVSYEEWLGRIDHRGGGDPFANRLDEPRQNRPIEDLVESLKIANCSVQDFSCKVDQTRNDRLFSPPTLDQNSWKG